MPGRLAELLIRHANGCAQLLLLKLLPAEAAFAACDALQLHAALHLLRPHSLQAALRDLLAASAAELAADACAEPLCELLGSGRPPPAGDALLAVTVSTRTEAWATALGCTPSPLTSVLVLSSPNGKRTHKRTSPSPRARVSGACRKAAGAAAATGRPAGGHENSPPQRGRAPSEEKHRVFSEGAATVTPRGATIALAPPALAP